VPSALEVASKNRKFTTQVFIFVIMYQSITLSYEMMPHCWVIGTLTFGDNTVASFFGVKISILTAEDETIMLP
jgi:hypothetical protein